MYELVHKPSFIAVLLGILPIFGAQAKDLVADEWSALSEDDAIERRELDYRFLPSLVGIDKFKTTIIAPGFASTYRTYRGAATMVVSGGLKHPFSTTVRDVVIRIGFFTKEKRALAWRRISTTPLMLTERELKQRMPFPSFHWVQDASHESIFPPKKTEKIRVETKFRDIRLQMRNLPALLVMLDEYSLDDPSPEDLDLIMTKGGVADLSAAASWADSVLLERPRWEESKRKKLINTIVGLLKTMRPPLLHGDLQRLHALMALINVIAQPQDLEDILKTNSNVSALMTSVGLSYYDAVRDENQFDIPIHKIRALPSLQEYLQSFKHALQEVRVHSIAELVELSFDPLDFRNAPENTFKISPVQSEARALLEPLSPVDVSELMAAATGQADTQERLLEFFVKVRHAPAIATLLHWLHENPKHADKLGIQAAKRMGALIVPALLRAFLEPRDALERAISRKMLLALPTEAQPAAVEALRGSGAMLAQDVDIKGAVDAFEHHEDQVLARKADLLEDSIFGSRSKERTLVQRMNMLVDLASSDPQRIEPRSRDIFALLASTAKHTMHSAPAHSSRALKLFQTLPFGSSKQAAQTTRTLTQTSMYELEGKTEKARNYLLKKDPELQNPHLRLEYARLSHKVIRDALDNGQYPKAKWAIKETQARLPHDDRLSVFNRELYFSRYKIAFILGGLGIISLLTCLAYLFARWAAPKLRRRGVQKHQKSVSPSNQGGRKASLEATQFNGEVSSQAWAEDEDENEDNALILGQHPPASEPEAAQPGGDTSAESHFADDFDDELDDEFGDFEAPNEAPDPVEELGSFSEASENKRASTPPEAESISAAQTDEAQEKDASAPASGGSEASATELDDAMSAPPTTEEGHEGERIHAEREENSEAAASALVDDLDFSESAEATSASTIPAPQDAPSNVDALDFSVEDAKNAA